MAEKIQKISPCLWFDSNAEEAVNYYMSVFKDSRIINLSRYSENMPMPEGTVMVIDFQLEGQNFMAINGGPVFTFSPAISLVVHCNDQKELDELWEKLSDRGEKQDCGWVKDRFGVSWQIVPIAFEEMMKSADAKKKKRVMMALFNMSKLDIATLQKAFEG